MRRHLDRLQSEAGLCAFIFFRLLILIYLKAPQNGVDKARRSTRTSIVEWNEASQFRSFKVHNWQRHHKFVPRAPVPSWLHPIWPWQISRQIERLNKIWTWKVKIYWTHKKQLNIIYGLKKHHRITALMWSSQLWRLRRISSGSVKSSAKSSVL